MTRLGVFVVASVLMGSALGGCRSNFAKIAPRPVGEATGRTGSGTGCGVIAAGFIPIRVNSRAARAYRYAIDNRRTQALTDVRVTDSWFWTPIGLFLCSGIEGTVVPAPSVPAPPR